jgi:hypothetical protein
LRVVSFFLRHADVCFDVARAAIQIFIGGQAVFDDLALLQCGLRFGLILPEIRIAGFRFERGKLLAGRFNVKENSARRRSVSSVP